jgi:uncharacterized protein YceH (UPF0502 family)
VLCLLLLRGPQTIGELRSRSDRMHAFEELASVQATLDRMAARETPLAVALPRAPGSREGRWMHLLGDPTAIPQQPLHPLAFNVDTDSLEQRVRVLEDRLSALEARLAELPQPSATPSAQSE